MESYLFVRVVGKGSYGEVNLVKHKSDRKQYVIKKLNLRTSSKRERRAAEQEAQLLSQLKHPNIVTYRESWEGEDCQLYIVMGFCEGGDLYHRLKQQKGDLLPERQVVEWFVQIAMALQYLHEKHILHRDLKTQNIFLTKTNIIKVGDLGIARVLENQYDMASTLIGTPYYMSPELFSNKPYNYKSDVWALGCCVYEMATLKHAFNAKDMNSLVYRIVEGKLPQMPGRYAPQLGELIKRMLCKRPEDRPDVKHILRQPYIKQQISIFLEATKEKTAKSRKKAPNSRANSAGPSVPANHQLGVPLQCVPSEPESHGKRKLCNGVRDVISPDSLLPPKSLREDIFNSTGQSVVTISNIDVAIQPKGKLKEAKPPRPKPASKPHSAPEQREREEGGTPMPKQLSGVCSGEGESAFPSKNPSTQEPPDLIDRTGFLKKGVAPGVGVAMEEDTLTLLRQGPVEDDAPGPRHTPFTDLKTENLSLAEAALKESLGSTEKLLQPFIPVTLEEVNNQQAPAVPSHHSTPPLHPLSSSSEPSTSHQRRQRKRQEAQECPSRVKAANLRPLPPLREGVLTGNAKERITGDGENANSTAVSATAHRASHKEDPASQNRLLSARERRRLRQSKENQTELAAPAIQRASCDVPSLVSKHTDQPDFSRPASVVAVTHKEQKSSWQESDEEECSSSTSSTERWEGDYREGKSETNEMQDLVQMMTQTLRMDARDVSCEQEDSHCHSDTLPEFRLNRKYRDTLMLHGKAQEGEANFPSDDSSGQAKIRRAIEHLRTDVLKGLGVKLLNKVLDIMQEEDEDRREVLLRQQMGEEKYKLYAVMVRQLKFFEDVTFRD
ncbi:serine/threonine-protein kinase Nek4 [Electrophorus electricus]|uniref:Serine/threonine-protein kinase Nek4 n=1 Tax=Electrophorus electricus TaxID=8005 RepID=A0A4W4EDZ2_ELEEL|nr:serine/threonine-protein kinase Nek4 [Electrophorus electricus]